MKSNPRFSIHRIKRLAKEGSWIIVGQIATVIASLVLVRVLTDHLSSMQYGQLALGLTVAGLINQVLMGGIIASAGRFYSIAVEKQDLGGYLHATRSLMLRATIVVGILGVVIFTGLLWLSYSNWIPLAAAALVFSVISAYNSVFYSIQNAARHRSTVAFYSSLDAWLKIGLVLGVMFWLGNSSTAVVIGYACSSLLILFSQLASLRHSLFTQRQDSAVDFQWQEKIWTFSLPFSTWGIFTWMQLASDRWALQTFATTTDVGHYAVLFQIGYTPIALATGLIMNFLSPIFSQISGDATCHVRNTNVHNLVWRSTQISLVITLFGFVITFFIHKWIFYLLVAEQYNSSSILLPWVVLAGGLFATGQMLSLKLTSELKTLSLSIVKISTALIGILCNVLGAMYYGVQGVVFGLVIFSTIYFIWMTVIGSNSLAKK